MENALRIKKDVGLKLLFGGDVRLVRPSKIGLLDDAVQAYALGHDVRCCNFEGAAYHENAVTQKKAGPAILQGADAPKRILDAGFNLVTLANNHVMDYGAAGLRAALAAFFDIAVIGAGTSEPIAYRPYILERDGIKAGFLAMTERQYGTMDGTVQVGTAWACSPQTRNNIRLLRSECSHVIVVCHAGLEDVDQPLPGWRALYHNFIDAGATAVICHHPHVAQGWERYKQGLILYSLGNLAWEPEDDFSEHRSLLASLTLLNDGKYAYEVRPVRFDGGLVHFDDSVEFAGHLDGINAVLNDGAAYEGAAQEICRAFYEDIALQDFYTVTGCLPGNLWQQSKNAGKLLVRKRALNAPLLKHMLDNESYRWAVSTALGGNGEAHDER